MAAGVLFLFTACNKDKYTTKPQLTFKSAKSYDVPRGDLIEFLIDFTDKEGDVSDTLYIQNRTASCPNSDYPLPIPYKVANFPGSSNLKGQFKIVYINGTTVPGYATYNGNACGRPDTTVFYFWLKDKANNVSDTIHTDKPIIIQN
jgi:hypothetical protein